MSSRQQAADREQVQVEKEKKVPYRQHEALRTNGQRVSGSYVQHCGSTDKCGEKISVLHKIRQKTLD